MRRKRRMKLVLFTCTALATILLVLAYLPDMLLHYVNKQPGIRAQGAFLSWGCITFKQVRVERENATLTTPSAKVCTGKTVVVDGGDAQFRVGSASGQKETSDRSYKITGKLDTASVSNESTKLLMKSVRIKNDQLLFDTGEVRVGNTYAHLYDGVASKKEVKAKYFTASVRYKDRLLNLTGEDAKLEMGQNKPHTVSADHVSVSDPSSKSGADVRKVKVEVDTRLTDFSISAEKLDVQTPDVQLRLYGAKIEKVAPNAGMDDLRAVKVGADTAEVFQPLLHTSSLTLRHPTVMMFPPSTQHFHILLSGGEPGLSVGLSIDNADARILALGSCEDWVLAMPKELQTDVLSATEFTGNLSISIHTSPPKLDVHQNCKPKTCNNGFFNKLRKPFEYTVYHKDGTTTFTRESGPGSRDWVPLSAVNDNMVKALLQTEDPGFFKHNGYVVQGLYNSLVENLKTNSIKRGGSTITMQLAKNLYLKRSKTFGRKAQEFLLTLALEACLTKQEILELYLNVVEFGPELYGIGPGSRVLLASNPSQLSLLESLYLTTRLPSPTRASTLKDRLPYLKMLMNVMAKKGQISDDQLQIELSSVEEP